MSSFPKTELQIVALAEQMVAGYTSHAADFPSVTVADLTAALTAYRNQRQTQEDADSQAKIATATKSDKLDALITLMKNDLKVSEVDTTAAPEKLAEIGWGPKSSLLRLRCRAYLPNCILYMNLRAQSALSGQSL